MTKLPFSNFDLPRQHLTGDGNYIPRRTRDEAEAARRRSLAPGTVLAEQQAKGMRIAATILSHELDDDAMRFTAQMLSQALLNTSWYTFGKDAPDVMRRRLWLPKMADHHSDWRQTAEGLRIVTAQHALATTGLAQAIATQASHNHVTKRTATSFGRQAGAFALHVALLEHVGIGQSGSAHEVQRDVRDIALVALDGARSSSEVLGSHASIAQLADYDSELGVTWRHEAPQDAYEAYLESYQATA